MYHLRPMENNIFVNLDWYYSWYYALRSKDTTHFLGKQFRLKISIFIIVALDALNQSVNAANLISPLLFPGGLMSSHPITEKLFLGMKTKCLLFISLKKVTWISEALLGASPRSKGNLAG